MISKLPSSRPSAQPREDEENHEASNGSGEAVAGESEIQQHSSPSAATQPVVKTPGKRGRKKKDVTAQNKSSKPVAGTGEESTPTVSEDNESEADCSLVDDGYTVYSKVFAR